MCEERCAIHDLIRLVMPSCHHLIIPSGHRGKTWMICRGLNWQNRSKSILRAFEKCDNHGVELAILTSVVMELDSK